MKQTILKFGLISGVFSSAMMVATVPLENKIGFDGSEYLGYTLIVLSFLRSFSASVPTATTSPTEKSPSLKPSSSASPSP